MRNVLRIFRRDVKRAARNPRVWLVLLFLVVLPSLYTWFNVAGFWDPYGHTGSIRVCVVNEDEGIDDETLGQLNVGKQVVGQLEENDQLGWYFTNREDALEQVRGSQAYAAVVIPADFSAKIATLLGTDPEQATLEYYVNEKENAVSPKITDAGSTTLDATINATVVSTASETVAGIVNEQLEDARSGVAQAKEGAVAKIADARDGIGEARDALGRLRKATDSGAVKAQKARAELAQAKEELDGLRTGLSKVPALTANASERLLSYSSSASALADRGSSLVSQSSTALSSGVASLSGDLTKGLASVDAATTRANAVIAENDAVIAEVQELEEEVSLPLLKRQLANIASSLQEQNDRARSAVETLEGVSTDLKDAAASSERAATGIDTAVQNALAGSADAREEITGSLVPAMAGALSEVGSLATTLSGSGASQDLAFEQADAVLAQLKTALASTDGAYDATDSALADLDETLSTAATDLQTISASQILGDVVGQGDLSPSKIAKFMKSPTLIDTVELYPLNAYGSGMAPLFINLTLWIGVFMLMVIIRLEVDDEGVPGATSGQRYFGRWLLIAALVVLQALVCCTGCLVMGVQAASVPLFYLTAVVAALTYLSIQYLLSTTLQHIGKGLCVALVFVQIPGATGLYPVELTNSFFQAVYDFLPFTYGINAMRETIAGFYDGTWSWCLGILALYFLANLLLGVALRKRTINLNRMFARKLKESDLFNIESVEMPEQRFGSRSVARAFANREVYRAVVEDRYRSFMLVYPRLKTGALVFGIVIPVVLTTLFSLLGFSRVWLLTTWLLWVVALMLFLVVVEFLRDRLERERRLEGLSDEELASAYVKRNEIGRSDATRAIEDDDGAHEAGPAEKGGAR